MRQKYVAVMVGDNDVKVLLERLFRNNNGQVSLRALQERLWERFKNK